MKFPYGNSDFYTIRKRNLFFQDNTKHILTMEEMGDYLLFLRPRRFGKSLWLSILMNYYDLRRKDDFDMLFGNLDIDRNPTENRNRYFVMRWDFSSVRTSGDSEQITKSLFSHINSVINGFMLDYEEYLPQGRSISFNDDAIRTFANLLALTRNTGHPFYLFIDEYDNFTHRVLAGSGETDYKTLVGSEGLLKYIFTDLKSCTSGQGLERIFATGVTPVVMSDISSGANILANISLDADVADLCGFTGQDVNNIIKTICKECGHSEGIGREAMAVMQTWYNGYRFNIAQPEKVYNPTLCLYFLKTFQRRCEYPDDMLDANLAPDEDKLEYLLTVPGGKNLLWQLIEEKQITLSRIENKFGLKAMLSSATKDSRFLASFLWYSGVVSLADDSIKNKLQLTVPNLVIKRLYAEQAQLELLPEPQHRDQVGEFTQLLFEKADFAPIAKFIEDTLFPIFSNRDLINTTETTIKAIFATTLFNDALYIMESEREYRKGYPDLVMVVRPDIRPVQDIIDIVIEFKYLKLADIGKSHNELADMDEAELLKLPKVAKQLKQGTYQVKRYAETLKPELKILAPNFNPHLWVVVALGFSRLVWRKVEN